MDYGDRLMDIDKMWVKFDELEVDCWCYKHNKKCPPEANPECKLYLVEFIEIMDEAKHDERCKALREATTRLEKQIADKLKKDATKFNKEINKNINKFKV